MANPAWANDAANNEFGLCEPFGSQLGAYSPSFRRCQPALPTENARITPLTCVYAQLTGSRWKIGVDGVARPCGSWEWLDLALVEAKDGLLDVRPAGGRVGGLGADDREARLAEDSERGHGVAGGAGVQWPDGDFLEEERQGAAGDALPPGGAIDRLFGFFRLRNMWWWSSWWAARRPRADLAQVVSAAQRRQHRIGGYVSILTELTQAQIAQNAFEGGDPAGNAGGRTRVVSGMDRPRYRPPPYTVRASPSTRTAPRAREQTADQPVGQPVRERLAHGRG